MNLSFDVVSIMIAWSAFKIRFVSSDTIYATSLDVDGGCAVIECDGDGSVATGA